MALTQKQINDLVAEYKKYYDGDEEVTEEKVLEDLKGYMEDFTSYESIEDVPFEELIDFIGWGDTMDAQTKATKKWNKNNREHRNYLSKRSSARSFIRNHASESDLNELEELIKEKKDKMITEKQLLKALEENFENFKEDMTFEEYADMLDFWVNKDGDILVEERGIEPVDGVRKVGYVDSGVIWEIWFLFILKTSSGVFLLMKSLTIIL